MDPRAARRGPLDLLPPELRRLLRPAPPEPGPPMLAKPAEPEAIGTLGAGWLFERKLDGIRLLADRGGERVRLSSRTGRPQQGVYPEIAAALAAQPASDFAVDGEVVALHEGRTDFGRLQQRMQLTDPRAVRASPVEVSYFVFDLLRLDGQDTTRLPLTARKTLLKAALDWTGPLHWTAHRTGGGAKLLAQAAAAGWEGVIAKRADSAYLHSRSTAWLKFKCGGVQEFVIGGYTEPAGSRIGFGALLLGYYEQGLLHYAGKVGTGFDTATLRVLRPYLDRLEQPHPAFYDRVAEPGAHWVRPVLVAQVGFTEWTRAGLLRQPRFLGIRDDKPAAQVGRAG
ncbi:non-homologous end-joining DNA ligase [Kitasatospora sp. LaBMicrA B282]|uniref:non-homologous end-joining DNA ligase n=1 Tax=Kitasatospora sp. LaBMicrA B282 TaxID=3420949 RepID=UPI003D14A37F